MCGAQGVGTRVTPTINTGYLTVIIVSTQTRPSSQVADVDIALVVIKPFAEIVGVLTLHHRHKDTQYQLQTYLRMFVTICTTVSTIMTPGRNKQPK